MEWSRHHVIHSRSVRCTSVGTCRKMFVRLFAEPHSAHVFQEGRRSSPCWHWTTADSQGRSVDGRWTNIWHGCWLPNTIHTNTMLKRTAFMQHKPPCILMSAAIHIGTSHSWFFNCNVCAKLAGFHMVLNCTRWGTIKQNPCNFLL